MSTSFTITDFHDANPKADEGPLITLVGGVFLSTATIAVILRVLGRVILKTGIKLDDILSIITLVLVTITVSTNFYGVNHNGLGTHAWTIDSVYHLHSFLLGLYVFEITYTISTAMVRFSTMALYLRMFRRSAALSRALIVVCILNTIWVIVVTLLGIFSCNPIDGFWLFETHAQCLDSARFFIGSASANIFLEVTVIGLPIPVICCLKMPRRQRLAVSCVLLLSVIIPIVAGFRLNELLVAAEHNVLHTDPTYSLVGSAMWSIIEICLGVTVSCLPCIRPLLRHLINRYGHEAITSIVESTPARSRMISMQQDRPIFHSMELRGRDSEPGLDGRQLLASTVSSMDVKRQDSIS